MIWKISKFCFLVHTNSWTYPFLSFYSLSLSPSPSLSLSSSFLFIVVSFAFSAPPQLGYFVRAGRTSKRSCAKDSLFTVTMSDPSRPPHFSHHSFSSDTRKTESSSRDRPASNFSQPPVGFLEAFPSSENPAGAFRTTTTSGNWPMNAKVPIPRTTSASTWTSSGRVSRACENCREQKAKCSGHRPTCQRCQEAGVQCSYGDRKREKMAKCVELDVFTRVTCLRF